MAECGTDFVPTLVAYKATMKHVSRRAILKKTTTRTLLFSASEPSRWKLRRLQVCAWPSAPTSSVNSTIFRATSF